VITPQQVEKRLFDLSKEMDEAHSDLVQAEHEFHTATANYEIAMAKSRMKNSHSDLKMTATMREDQALIENEAMHLRLAIAEASVKASRANVNRIRTQVDITRSISSSIKATLEL
jgi:outer membrane protein TolC